MLFTSAGYTPYQRPPRPLGTRPSRNASTGIESLKIAPPSLLLSDRLTAGSYAVALSIWIRGLLLSDRLTAGSYAVALSIWIRGLLLSDRLTAGSYAVALSIWIRGLLH